MPVRCQRRSLCSCVGKRGMRSEMRKERSAGDVVFWGVVLGLTTLLLLYLVVPFGALFPRLSLPDVLQVVQDLSLIHISEPTRLRRISYAVFCLKIKKKKKNKPKRHYLSFFFFFFNDTATTEIYTSLFVGSVRCV